MLYFDHFRDIISKPRMMEIIALTLELQKTNMCKFRDVREFCLFHTPKPISKSNILTNYF